MSSNIEVKLDVLNQLATPAMYAAALANRPAAGFVGRIFFDSDNPSTGIYRDTGTTWVQVADETGTIPTPTLQTVTTAGNTSNVGISITANGIGIGTTIPASNRLDIHTATGINATFNGTGTTNSALQLQSAGVGKWTIQNNYNSAANDFVLTDVASSVNRLVIKNTGLATYTGYFNVANIASSQNIQISGTAPAYTIIDVAGSGYAASLGMATVANNFIQGSVLGDLCLVSQNTIAGNLKLGVGSSNAAALNISPANRVQIGTSTDAGYRLDINGTTRAQGQLTNTTGGIYVNYSSPQFTLVNAASGNKSWSFIESGNDLQVREDGIGFPMVFKPAGNVIANQSGGNFIIGSTTDAGYKFDVLGTARVQTNMFVGTRGQSTSYTGSNYLFIGNGTISGFNGGGAGDLVLQTNSYYNGTNSIYSISSYASILSLNNTGQIYFGFAPSGTAGNTVTFTQSALVFNSGNWQFGTSTTEIPSSKLTISSTTQGFLPPKMTTAQKNAISSPVSGLVVYDTTLNKLALYTGAAWETVTSI